MQDRDFIDTAIGMHREADPDHTHDALPMKGCRVVRLGIVLGHQQHLRRPARSGQAQKQHHDTPPHALTPHLNTKLGKDIEARGRGPGTE